MVLNVRTEHPGIEVVAKFEETYIGRTVLVTGITGFTGSWLARWLIDLGAQVSGIALPPERDESLFNLLKLNDVTSTHYEDINSREAVKRVIKEEQPEIIFHLAAQPLVSEGYHNPIDTFMTNIIGTSHVLDAASDCASTRALVCITTDKVYENKGWLWSYREMDSLGGKDPYSASKACAELIAKCYQDTMLGHKNSKLAIATARGGNIVGGGDWSADRIVPDFYRAVASGASLKLRNPNSTRPWQHVLALVHGYLMLGTQLFVSPSKAIGAWNFGPSSDEHKQVRDLVDTLSGSWEAPATNLSPGLFDEAKILSLDSTKAKMELGWIPSWDFNTSIEMTGKWYKAFNEQPDTIAEVSRNQLGAYRSRIRDT